MEVSTKNSEVQRLAWYGSPIYAAFWIALFFLVTHNQLNNLPRPLTRIDESNEKYANAFIAQRAEHILSNLTALGPKVFGTFENENLTVQFLLNEINEIKKNAANVFEFEVDMQLATGVILFSRSLAPFYKNVQNIAVKIHHTRSNNENYLLLNSHFDTVSGSPGAGDAGSMIVVMLEVMRVITKSAEFIEHPIVFLFNGAEETGLLGSHAFITQHKWAKNCKAVINLDAAGNSGREILFQSGPANGWLLDYYESVPYPFGMALAEEVFQAGVIPSDTDFRFFRDYGSIPGLDIAYINNGYVYHTKYDQFTSVDPGALQHTGSNVLALTRELGNAKELNNDVPMSQDTMIFYDYLGWFLVCYSKTEGTIVNCVICAATLIIVAISFYSIHRQSGFCITEFSSILGIQLLSVALACGLPVLVAFLLGDVFHHVMTWFSSTWLVFGIYFCPTFFGMLILPAIYVELKEMKDTFSLVNTVQLFMHFHCMLLLVVTIVLTAYGIRAAYLGTIAIICYFFGVIISLVMKANRNVYLFGLVITICQIPSFLYFTYVTEVLYELFIPILGRSGSNSRPEFYIAGFAIIASLLFAGFILPLFLIYRKSILAASIIGIGCLFCVTLSFTPLGFPYTAQTAPARLDVYYFNRIVSNESGVVIISDSGILVDPLDAYISADDVMHYGELLTTDKVCESTEFCGLPHGKYTSYWVPMDKFPPLTARYPDVKVLQTEQDGLEKKFRFSIMGPQVMNILIQPINNYKFVSLTLNNEILALNTYDPFYIRLKSGNQEETISISVAVLASNTKRMTTKSVFLSVTGFSLFKNNNEQSGENFENYINSYPDYVYVSSRVATYETWVF